jgi:hypothetical protein
MAEARGFADEVKLPVLAKLMLAERFMPRLFDQIASAASASPEGKCADLLALERAKTEITETEDATGGVAAGPRSSGGAKAALAPDSAQLTEWLSSPQTRAWANIEPSIGDRDLRAYLFVAKDRRDYFGAASVLGHLSSVAEKLLGPKLAVQAMEPNLRQLAPLEAGEIFEIVRRKIISADEYVKEPEGIAGLVVLVKAHPSLQASMLDLLESIPHDRVGPWVCVGWESALRDDDAKTRFDVLLDLLAKKGMAMTKTSAAAALRMRRKEK